MARMDELEVGDMVTVTNLRDGTHNHGEIVRLEKGDAVSERVIVLYDVGGTVRVGPGFVTPDVGE